MPKFESKYTANDLVEFEKSKTCDRNYFARVVEIHFRKTDAVNFSASYTLQLVNSEEIIRDVYEHQIIKLYTLDERAR